MFISLNSKPQNPKSRDQPKTLNSKFQNLDSNLKLQILNLKHQTSDPESQPPNPWDPAEPFALISDTLEPWITNANIRSST